MLKSIILSVSAIGLAATPIAASAAAATPASKLSLSPSARAGTSVGKTNRLAGSGTGTIAAAIIGAGIAIGAVILITDKEDEDNPDSN